MWPYPLRTILYTGIVAGRALGDSSESAVTTRQENWEVMEPSSGQPYMAGELWLVGTHKHTHVACQLQEQCRTAEFFISL